MGASEATGVGLGSSKATGVGLGATGDDLADATAVVIASHGGPEAEIIRAALDSGVGYVGLVASRVRGASVLGGLGLTEEEQARVHTPVGLPIGAKTPAEIAVSIMAEVIAALRVEGLSSTDRAVDAPAQAIDPVCGMAVAVGPSALRLSVAAEDFWFCSAACRSTFSTTRVTT